MNNELYKDIFKRKSFHLFRYIGSLWLGIGKPDIQTYEGLDFVIMIAVHKVNNLTRYRKDMFKAKRKSLEEIWNGDTLGIAEAVTYYNRIDIGIFLCILELCMAEKGIYSKRVLYSDTADDEYSKVAEYQLISEE